MLLILCCYGIRGKVTFFIGVVCLQGEGDHEQTDPTSPRQDDYTSSTPPKQGDHTLSFQERATIPLTPGKGDHAPLTPGQDDYNPSLQNRVTIPFTPGKGDTLGQGDHTPVTPG